MQSEIPFNKIKTIFFDYDGTIHDSIKIYGPAFRKMYAHLVEQEYAEDRIWSDKEISFWLGYNPLEMWADFMPHLNESARKKFSAIIGDEMNALTENKKAQLYEGALDTLNYLKTKGYILVFISNCKISYKDRHSKAFHLNEYFAELVCSEEYGFAPKQEILRYIKMKYPKEMVIVGDRIQDIHAGKENDIYTIGCKYGFSFPGELNGADAIIERIVDLKKLL